MFIEANKNYYGLEIFRKSRIIIYDLDQTTIHSAISAFRKAENIFKSLGFDTSGINFLPEQNLLFDQIRIWGVSLGMDPKEALAIDHGIWEDPEVIGMSDPIAGAAELVHWAHSEGKFNWASSSRPKKFLDITRDQIKRHFGNDIDKVFVNKTNDHRFGVARKNEVIEKGYRYSFKSIVIDDSMSHIEGIAKYLDVRGIPLEYVHLILSPYGGMQVDHSLVQKYPGRISIIPRGEGQSIKPIHEFLSGKSL